MDINTTTMDNVTDFIESNKESITSSVRYKAIKLLSLHERTDAYLDKILDNEQKNSDLSPADSALLNELVCGVIRWKAKIDWALTGFYRGDYQKCLNIVKNAMRVALYQLMFLNKIPAYAAINESVEVVKRIQGEKTANIVNGVLRNIQRNMENIRYPEPEEDIIYYLSTLHSHPKWMVKRWLERFGLDETTKLLEANNIRPNIFLRINTLKTTAESFYNHLESKGVPYVRSEYLNESFYIVNPRRSLESTDAFKNGLVTVQDVSASLAVRLADVKPGMSVIDLCAAPGGKSFYLAELMKNQGKVLAVEKYSSKERFILEGAERLGINIIQIQNADATSITSEELFDVVFADVPCSGLGTLSKKPDIKWKRDIDDIPKLVNLQREILRNASRLVKVGGALIYSTCTIEKEENEDNIEWFLKEFENYYLDPAENYLPPSVCKDGYMQTFPHRHSIDGAFAARLIRKY